MGAILAVSGFNNCSLIHAVMRAFGKKSSINEKN